MKTSIIKILTLVQFVFVFTILSYAQSEPKAVIHPAGYDFGNIQQDSIVTRNFVIKNEGSGVLEIIKVSASCGCTAVVPEKNELKPNESTDIKVTFNSKGKSGKQNKIITIETNDPKNSTIKLTLTGTVLKNEIQSNNLKK